MQLTTEQVFYEDHLRGFTMNNEEAYEAIQLIRTLTMRLTEHLSDRWRPQADDPISVDLVIGAVNGLELLSGYLQRNLLDQIVERSSQT